MINIFYLFVLATTNESSNTASIVAGVLVPFFLIIIIIIVVYFVYQHYQKKQIEENAKPNPKFANGEVRNRRKNVHDGVIYNDKSPAKIRRESSIVISVPSVNIYGELDDYDYGNDISHYENIPPITIEEATPVGSIVESPAKKKRRKKSGKLRGKGKTTGRYQQFDGERNSLATPRSKVPMHMVKIFNLNQKEQILA